jgi:hypothetical protein
MMDVLTPQPSHVGNRLIDMWVDERIWGHRFHDEQTPWLVLLEFFAVFRSRSQTGSALAEGRVNGHHENIQYGIPKLGPLRFLVFNNPYLRYIEDSTSNDAERWRRWLESVVHNPVWHDFGYLKDRFGEFSRLVRVVEFFQNTSIEPQLQRRWTSKFLFPYGPDCIYADVAQRGGLGNPDRLFFARSGELLYLMLNRSSHAKVLAEKITNKLMKSEERWNCLARTLLPDDYEVDGERVFPVRIGYLPYEKRSEYEALAEDWLRLLGLKIPGAATLDPLMRLTGLHLILYMLRRSLEEIGDDGEPRIVLEIAAPRKTILFDLSAESYSANRTLSRRALESHLLTIQVTDDWRKALGERDPSEATFRLLKERFYWKRDDRPSGSPERIFNEFLNAARKRHGNHVGKVPTDWSRRIGLSVSRRGTGTWYSPDDAFLKALVMATVDEREEYHRFLARLYDRYRLATDERVLADNANRLEQRLRTLGLLHRLSDDCAYVINPFGGRHDTQ